MSLKAAVSAATSLSRAADGQPAAGLQRLDGAHRRGQPAQRRDHRRSSSMLRTTETREADDEDHRLRVGHGVADLDRREEQQQRGDREHDRVGEQDPQ